jgi:hypothetical protein
VHFNISAGTFSPLSQLVIIGRASIIFLFPDLRPLFNWNTKQLFVYLAAEYDGARGVSASLFYFILFLSYCNPWPSFGTGSGEGRLSTLSAPRSNPNISFD